MEVSATLALPQATAAAAPPGPWPNRFERLGQGFFTRLGAEPLPDPHWVTHSPECAAMLGFPADWCRRADAFTGPG